MKSTFMQNLRPVGRSLALRRTVSALALACGLMGAALPPAYANLMVTLSVDGGALQTLASGPNSGMLTFTYSNPVLDINGSANSNSPGTTNLAKVIGSTLNITNLSASAHTIALIVGVTDFMAPIAPPMVKINSHIGGSVTIDNATNVAAFTSCVDPNNLQNNCESALFVVGPSHPNITANSFNADAFLYTNGPLSLYSITQALEFRLGARSEINTAANTTISRVPEPASLALLGIGLLASGLLQQRRR